jgi:hypothetical protein
MHSRRSSWAGRSRRPWPMIVQFPQIGHRRGNRSSGITPGSMLSFASGSAIKRITAGVKARRRRFSAKFSIRWPGLHPPAKSDSNEKRIQLCVVGGDPLRTLAALKAQLGESSGCARRRITPEVSWLRLALLRQTSRSVGMGLRIVVKAVQVLWSAGFSPACWVFDCARPPRTPLRPERRPRRVWKPPAGVDA